jgi:hypothetical protein
MTVSRSVSGNPRSDRPGTGASRHSARARSPLACRGTAQVRDATLSVPALDRDRDLREPHAVTSWRWARSCGNHE